MAWVDIVWVIAGRSFQVAFNTGSGFADPISVRYPNWLAATADSLLSGRLPNQSFSIPFTDQQVSLTAPANAVLNGLRQAVRGASVSGLFPNVLDWSASVGHGGGLGVSASVPIIGTKHCRQWRSRCGESISWSEALFNDINGDGLPEPIRRVPNPTGGFSLVSMPNLLGEVNRLKTITIPLGGVIELTYRRVGNTFDMPQSRYVLSSVVQRSGSSNGVSNTALATNERDVAANGDSDLAVSGQILRRQIRSPQS